MQFAASRGITTVRAEAVSNEYLEPPFTLDEPQSEALLSMGWNPPTLEEGGNFYRDWEAKNEEDRRLIAHAVKLWSRFLCRSPTGAAPPSST